MIEKCRSLFFMFLFLNVCGLCNSLPAVGQQVEDFYGTWWPVDQGKMKCADIDEETEGPQIIIGPEKLMVMVSECEDVRFVLDRDTLRVFASCISAEGPIFDNLLGEKLVLTKGKVLRTRWGNYRKCLP